MAVDLNKHPGRVLGSSKVKPVTDKVRGPGKISIQLQINDKQYRLEVEPRRTLLDVLRMDLHLTGTKKVCDMGECGACTVILDGKAVYACLILAIECEGHAVLTIEGLSNGERLNPVQQAFIEKDGFQCGFCTSGQIMSIQALLEETADPDQKAIRQAVAGNICRCGAYQRIFAAAEAAAKAYSTKKSSKKTRR